MALNGSPTTNKETLLVFDFSKISLINPISIISLSVKLFFSVNLEESIPKIDEEVEEGNWQAHIICSELKMNIFYG